MSDLTGTFRRFLRSALYNDPPEGLPGFDVGNEGTFAVLLIVCVGLGSLAVIAAIALYRLCA